MSTGQDSFKQPNQTRRMRRLQIITAASLLMMTTLAFFSIDSYNAREKADNERNNALIRLKENYRHLGHTAFLEDRLEHALLYFNEVRRIDPPETRINLEMADAWASVSAQHIFPAGEREIRRIDFSADSSRLLSQDSDGRIRLFDIVSGESRSLSSGPGLYRLNAEDHHFAEKTQRIAIYRETADPDKPGHFVRQVDIINPDGQPSGISLPGLSPDLLNMSPQGTYLLTGSSKKREGEAIGIWTLNSDPPTFQPLPLGEASGNYLWRFSGDENYLFQIEYTGDKPFELYRRDADSGEILSQFKPPHRVTTTSMHNDLAAFGFVDGSLQIYSVENGALLWEERSFHPTDIVSLEFSADGQFLLSVDMFGKAAIWDSKSMKDAPIWHTPRHDGVAKAADLSADGRLIAIAHDRSLHVYRVGDDAPLSFRDGHDAPVTAVSLSNDNKSVAVATSSGKVKIWHVQIEEPREVETRLPSRTRRITQNPDESFLAYGDALYGVWPTSGKTKKLADNISFNQTLLVEDSLVVDYNYGWMTLVKYDGNEIVSRNKLSFETDWTGIPTGMLGVPPRKGPVSLVYAAPGDKLYAFDRDGRTLQHSLPLNKNRGNPSSFTFNAEGSTGVVSFTDQRLLQFTITPDGVSIGEWHPLPSALKETRIVDWIDSSGSLLLQSDSGFHLYDLKKKSLQKIPGDNLSAARGVDHAGQPLIVSVNVQGMLEIWDLSSKRLVQNRLARGSIKSNELFKSAQVIVGKSIAISSDNSMAATSIDDRVYIWDIATGDLLWRSRPLETSLNSGLVVMSFIDHDTKLIVSSMKNTTLISLTLGGPVPPVAELDDYLQNRLKLSLKGSRAVTQPDSP